MAKVPTGVEAFKYRDMINSQFILLNGADHLTYQGIYDTYANSRFGLHHAQQPARYSQAYAYDRDTMIKDLGDDVHPVRHMAHTELALVRPLATAQNGWGREHLEPEEVVNLRLAALVHDTGECTDPEIEKALGHTVGDVHYETKTQTDDEKEKLVRQYLYGQLYDHVPVDLLVAADDIIDHKEGSLPREAFNAVERLGYYLTAIRAGQVALKLLEGSGDTTPDLRTVQLGRLALRVTGNHREFLQERSERFPHLQTMLDVTANSDVRIHQHLEHLAEMSFQVA